MLGGVRTSLTTTTGVRERVVWVTARGVPVDHAVTEDGMDAGFAGRGFVAVCGALFHPAPHISPPKPGCPLCRAILRRARPTDAQPTDARPSWWRRMLRSGR